jgi:hypothetical protein
VQEKRFEPQVSGMTRIDDAELHASAQQYNKELTTLRVLRIKSIGSYRKKSSGIL